MTDINLEAMHNEMTEQIAKIKQDQAAKISQEVFKASLVKFFDAVPEIKAIFWRQYTPYFNDGDSCEFAVGDVNFYMEDREEDDENGYNAYDPFRKPSKYVYEAAADTNNKYRDEYNKQIEVYNERVAKYTPERVDQIQRAMADVKELFRTINDDYFLMMFGDHVEITATKDGFQVDEFDHD